ncbi:hypothetical protein ACIQXA_29780 [Streptomyces massasporeus]|uniref:hypothetical protein n=1 Tax=Streptomyces massasporeus TaxID=67324 RepID=UPI003811CB96
MAESCGFSWNTDRLRMAESCGFNWNTDRLRTAGSRTGLAAAGGPAFRNRPHPLP